MYTYKNTCINKCYNRQITQGGYTPHVPVQSQFPQNVVSARTEVSYISKFNTVFFSIFFCLYICVSLW